VVLVNLAGLRTVMRTSLLVNRSFKQDMKQPLVFPVAVFLLCLSVSACAPKKDMAWSQDKGLILQSLDDINQSEKLTKSNMDLLNQRMTRLEHRLAKQELALEALKRSVRKQKMRQKKRALEQKQQRDMQVHQKENNLVPKVIAVTQPKPKLPMVVGARTLTPKKSIQHASVVDARDADLNKKSKEKDLYTAAYLSLKSGRYDEAIVSFKDLLHQFPKGELVDQAYYWLGESFLSKGDFVHAIESFSSLVGAYPKSGKYQPALLRLAMAYQETHHMADAKAVLQRLVQEYPDSRASEKARTRLAAMQGKGA